MNDPVTQTNREHGRRVATTFKDAELEKIDEWGFSRRIRDRSEAIRRLVHIGLAEGAADART